MLLSRILDSNFIIDGIPVYTPINAQGWSVQFDIIVVETTEQEEEADFISLSLSMRLRLTKNKLRLGQVAGTFRRWLGFLADDCVQRGPPSDTLPKRLLPNISVQKHIHLYIF